MSWLPVPTLLPDGSSGEQRLLATKWTAITTRAETLAHGIGQGQNPGERKARAIRLLRANDIQALKDAVDSDPRLHRAVATVWTEDSGLAAESLRKSTLAAVFGTQRVSRMTTRSLAGILLRDFSRIEQWEAGLFDYYTGLVRWAVESVRFSPRTRRNVLRTMDSHPDWFLEANAPETVARHLIRSRIGLDDFLADIGAKGVPGGTYADEIRQALFLKRLERVDPALDDPIHHELRNAAVYQAPTAAGGYFGHRILKILSSPKKAPGTVWLDTILHIAGDPRLNHSQQWTTWWSGVEPTVRAKVMGWLSTEDLRLFLAAVEEYGQSMDHDDLGRMFPARKTFLEGLLEMGLVRETRLFMGNEARTHLRRRLDKHVLSDITPLMDSADKETSVIYVNCGRFHLVEGTHNFKLWIYNGNPAPSLVDRSKRDFTQKRLRQGIPQEFLNGYKMTVPSSTKALGKSRRHVAIIHNGLWQQLALEALEHFGHVLPAESLMDSQSYKKYRKGVGPTRPSSRWK